MDTGSIRPVGYATAAQPYHRENPVVQESATVSQVGPPEKSEKSASHDEQVKSADTTDGADVRSGYVRDPKSGTMVFQRIDTLTSQVLLQLPKLTETGNSSIYEEAIASTIGASATVNRSA